MTERTRLGLRPGDHRPGRAGCSTPGTPSRSWAERPRRRRPGPRPDGAHRRARRRPPTAACASTWCSPRSTWTPPPADVADAYLRLHLLSHRLVQPHGLNLDGIFGVLTNVVWTTPGPCAGRRLRAAPGWRCAGAGRSQVFGIDKFPRMTDYVVPTGVRIADADRVRLGAHLAVGHDRHARGLRQLQRRHARRVDGRGPDLGRRRRRRRLATSAAARRSWARCPAAARSASRSASAA